MWCCLVFYSVSPLLCSGVWDVMSNEEVIDFVRKRIAEKMYPPQVLYDSCMEGS